jgi:PKD repeat protein
MTPRMTVLVRPLLAPLLTAAIGGCTLGDRPAPALAGPSEPALSLTLAASPDQILQDGASQSVVIATARDAFGRAVEGLALHVDLLVNGVQADFGMVSSRSLLTAADGRASIAYFAPPPPPPTAGADNLITIRMTPIGTDFGASSARSVQIRLLRPGVILPPNADPLASFFFSPQQPHENEVVQFDASGSKDDGEIVSLFWSFGDGTSGSGLRVSHRYAVAASYTVMLTVRDDRGATVSSAPMTVVVIPAVDPQPAFTISPTNPSVGTMVSVNAAASTVSPGRTIVSYAWDFGDGATGSGATASHVYTLGRTFTIVLTITDSTGRKASTSKTLIVGQ